ncbi:hypothetical protein IGI04_036646, partial [Brassica rapa subsp. trilocularis]
MPKKKPKKPSPTQFAKSSVPSPIKSELPPAPKLMRILSIPLPPRTDRPADRSKFSQVEAEVNGTSDAAGSSKKLATADARDDSLGSQLAIPKVILPVQNAPRGRKTTRSRSRIKQTWVEVDKTPPTANPPVPAQTELTVARSTGHVELAQQSMLGTGTDKVRGESSGTAGYLWSGIPRSASATSRSSQSEVQPDSSDVESSDSELEDGEFSKHELDFQVV